MINFAFFLVDAPQVYIEFKEYEIKKSKYSRS